MLRNILIGFVFAQWASAGSTGSGTLECYWRGAATEGLLRTAISEAGEQGKRVLVRYGGAWCANCDRVAKVLGEVAAPGLIRIAIDEPDFSTLRAWAASHQVTIRPGDGPVSAVLDGEGKLLYTGSWGESDASDFLARWSPAQPRAEAQLADGLARAKAGNKRVLVDFRADWCAPCRRLDEFLHAADAGAILQRSYEIVSVDIAFASGGRELASRLGSIENDGLPWVAILDATGAVIATSDIGKRNVGFPASAEDRMWFSRMLGSQTSGQADSLLRMLTRY